MRIMNKQIEKLENRAMKAGLAAIVFVAAAPIADLVLDNNVITSMLAGASLVSTAIGSYDNRRIGRLEDTTANNHLVPLSR